MRSPRFKQSAPASQRRGRTAPRSVALSLVIALVAAAVTVVSPASPAVAVPGTPGTPQNPPTLYAENFENGSGVTELEAYPSSGVGYTADSYWLNARRCNGFIVAYDSPNVDLTQYCNNTQSNYDQVRVKAYALGLLDDPTDPTRPLDPTSNRALSTNSSGSRDSTNIGEDNSPISASDGTATPNGIMFATSGQISLPSATGRFISFSVDASASACFAAAPLLRFYLRRGDDTLVPVSSSAINPCTDPRASTTTVDGNEISYGRFPANGSQLLTGTSSVGIVLRNEQPASDGNDGAIDNIQILDVTPQLDKSFSPASATTGGTSTLTLTITNSSDLAAKSGFSFTDTLPTGLTVAAGVTPSTTCAAGGVTAPVGGNSVVLTGGGLAAGQVSCTVTVAVTSPVPGSFSNGPANVSAVGLNPPGTSTVTFSNPSIALVKSGTATDVNDDGLIAAGDTISYSFRVTNTGDVPLTAVGVTDVKVGAVTCERSSLLPGEFQICTSAPYTVTAADVDNGSVVNSATATGTPPFGPPVSATSTTTTATQRPVPDIDVVKSASPSSRASYTVGQRIVYSFGVTNTGNVALTDVTVDDSDFSGTGTLGPIVCPGGASTVAALAPGGSTTCTADYVLTQADVDAQQVTNTARATGTPPPGDGPPPVSPPSRVVIPNVPAPAVAITKNASPATVTTVGATITYSFIVTNIGNVTLTDATVTEESFSGTGTLGPITCPGGGDTVATLASGESATCTATYVTTQADIDSAAITNTATASGLPPTGPRVSSPPATRLIPTPDTPAIAVVKTAGVQRIARAGETIVYSFAVTNTGNVTLTDARVVEGRFTGTGTLGPIACPGTGTNSIATLAPGATVTCTAAYVTTQADVTAARISNTATATGTPPPGSDGVSPVSPPSTVEVSGANLAATGTDVSPLGGLAATLLVAAGLAVMLWARRRRHV